MKTRIVIIGDGWKKLGKSKIFDWPFDHLPEKDNTISKEIIPTEILWNNQGIKDFYKRMFECCDHLLVASKNFFHDGDEKVIEILIEI